MTDITNTHLEAAFIDQNVAGAFHGKDYAFIAVTGGGAWQLGIAVANEQGYNQISGKTFKSKAEADEWAAGLNKHIGLSDDDRVKIICSSMRGRPFIKVVAA